MCKYHKKCQIEDDKSKAEISHQVFKDKIVCKAHTIQIIREQLESIEEDFIDEMEKENVA